MTRIPEIIAHRGAPRAALENTLASFEIALEEAADGIELDVHASRDGVVVVHHDPVIRICRAEGEVRSLRIAACDAADLRAAPLARGVGPLPTLDEVLELIGTRAAVYVEAKAPAIERPLATCLRRHRASRLAVHAFDHRIPIAMRASDPELAIGLLSSSYPVNLSGFIGATPPQSFWQQAQLIDGALVDAAHSMGMRVIAWTENDAVHARSLIAIGVDALCTDTPGLLRTALADD